MSVDECKKLIEQLNAKIPKDEIEKLYAQSDTNRDELDEEDFIGFYYSLLNRRPELDEVFIKYSNSSKKGKMTAEDLSNFLNHEQKIELPLEVCTFFFFRKVDSNWYKFLILQECQKIIGAFEPSNDKTVLSNEGFIQFFLFSELHSITDESLQKMVHHDM